MSVDLVIRRAEYERRFSEADWEESFSLLNLVQRV